MSGVAASSPGGPARRGRAAYAAYHSTAKKWHTVPVSTGAQAPRNMKDLLALQVVLLLLPLWLEPTNPAAFGAVATILGAAVAFLASLLYYDR